MNRFSLKAVKALVLIGVVGGVVVGCNDVASVKAPLPAEENTPVAGVVANRNGSAMLTADEREAKKREFFAKPEVKEMSAGLEEIAQAVAVAVEDKTLRDRIYAKCMEKFDGETNVLWQQLDADVNLWSRGGWSKQVDDLVGKGRKNTTIKGIGNVDAAIKKFEKLIDAPLHLFWAFPENWDKKTTPIVAFVSMTDDPEKQKTISAFDGKGNRLELSNHDATVAKERPVLVITFNERSSTDGRVKNGIKTTKGLDVNQQVAKQKDPKLQVFVSGGSSTVRLNSVTVPAVASNAALFMDELWWEGGPEWIYTFQVGGTVSGWGYWWPWTNHILGVGNFWSATTYSPNAVHSLIPPSAADQDFVTDAEFKYYEDDATPGQWDIFDDWWGFHYWRATSNGTGGAIIYTLPQPGSTVTRYDLNPNVTTVGNYTWQ